MLETLWQRVPTSLDILNTFKFCINHSFPAGDSVSLFNDAANFKRFHLQVNTLNKSSMNSVCLYKNYNLYVFVLFNFGTNTTNLFMCTFHFLQNTLCPTS